MMVFMPLVLKKMSVKLLHLATWSHLITQAVRHRVSQWARFVFRIIIIIIIIIIMFCFVGGGSTSGLMLIGWRAANMSSGVERNVSE